jgi:hydroxyacylglutathione hydrolase
VKHLRLSFDEVEVHRFSNYPFGTHTYVLAYDNEIFVIDPGYESSAIVQKLDDLNIPRVDRLICTHGHFDHVFGCSTFLHKYGVLPEIHRDEDKTLKSVKFQMAVCGVRGSYEEVEFNFKDLEDFRLDVIHTPGHTPGSCCFMLDTLVFTGDTFYIDEIPPSRLPGAENDLLRASIDLLKSKLSEQSVVLPGHGSFQRGWSEC